jgi:hypothetical protein
MPDLTGLKINELPAATAVDINSLFVISDEATGIAKKATETQLKNGLGTIPATETVPGMVELATDAEMQITAAVAEDGKVSSRLKIFNWFAWIKQNIQTITAEWRFAFIKLTGDVPTTPASGHMWHASGNYKVYKTAEESIITSVSNTTLAGATERVVTAGTAGGLSGVYDLIEEIVTDITIINACNAGTYNSGNGFTSVISPGPGVTFYKGQRCKQAFYMYIAWDDNTATRIPLG